MLAFINLACFFLLLIQPHIAFPAATDALALFAQNILPTLFPLAVAASLLVGTPAMNGFSTLVAPIMRGAFGLPKDSSGAFVVSLASGSPVGAINAASIIKSEELDHQKALTFSILVSLISPAFFLSTLNASLPPYCGLLLLSSHWFSHIAICALFKTKYIPISTNRKANQPIDYADAIKNNAYTMLPICATIVWFSVLYAYIEAILPVSLQNIGGMIHGFIEMAGGSFDIIASDLPMAIKLTALSFVTGFGGLAISIQNMIFFSSCGINKLHYYALKLACGLVSAGTTFVIASSINYAIPASSVSTESYVRMPLFTIISFALLLLALLLRKEDEKS